MKNIVAIIAVALATSAPVYAESAAELFALSNDSAAERVVGETSVGDVTGAKLKFAQNESPAEMNINLVKDGDVTRSNAAQAFFALGTDSAAERIVN
jgi:hypothetical protein